MEGTDDLRKIKGFENPEPHESLGAMPIGMGRYKIRAHLPRAERAWIETSNTGSKVELKGTDISTIYETEVDYDLIEKGYTLCYSDSSGYVSKRHDPYLFKPLLSDFDIFLYGKGELMKSYETFGSHLEEINGIKGVRFVVWAPNAAAVSVIGNFNHWTTGSHPMTNVRGSGIWELYIPELEEGEVYKFAIRSKENNRVIQKTDPYAFNTEVRPRTGSIVTSGSFKWADARWIAARGSHKPEDEAISVYEVHLGSWKKPGEYQFYSLREIGRQLIDHAKGFGFTHIELLPIMEHPLDESWGYQVVNYFAPTARYGKPEDYKWFINECHKNGIGVILDWVPAHFPDDDYGLSMFDGTHLYDHQDPRIGMHPDWGTRIFNYGRNEVRNFLLSNALYWIDQFHADGIRIDAVSSMLYLDYSRKPGEWLPNKYGGRENLDAVQFLMNLNSEIHKQFPGVITVAEESTAWGGVTKHPEIGGLGFDFKWNMGWMHDTLEYFSKDPIYRKFEHDKLTFSIWYAFSEHFILPLSHDEVVHLKGSLYRKMPGNEDDKFANLRLLFLYMFGSPGKKLIFMGAEFAQVEEWNQHMGLSWGYPGDDKRNGLKLFISDLNKLYRNSEALHALDCDSSGFDWIDFQDRNQSVISFIRKSGKKGDFLVFVLNFTPMQRNLYAIGVPVEGEYLEVMNSDASEYGGTGTGNFGVVTSSKLPFHGQEHSIEITLPPLGGIVLKRRNGGSDN